MLGRPERFIRERLRLNELIPEIVEEVSKGWLPIGHAMELSRFPSATQKSVIADEVLYDWAPTGQPPGNHHFADFKSMLKEQYQFSLKEARFSLTDVRLHPEGLACTACPERTGFEPVLFEEDLKDGDSCLNEGCFKTKEKAFYQITRTDLAVKQKLAPEKIEFASEKGFYGDALKDEKVHAWAKIFKRRECESVKPVMRIDGTDAGSLGYI
ncbi:MAG: hypothetical protein ACREBC_38785, partial [Pyrinomonadaceae bacterium]